ncbi:hypothetical protein OG786_21000 [Streptomyces sp. NBC_00101]|uniref:hypothetical protein n=1 Tax=Streptomyces sp. NBC_00101 TaxID=2975651 RepID=UPI0032559D32
MDQGDAAVWGAAITGAIGAIGAACAYAAGKAQARGMVEGVKLQLRGERESAIWLAQRDASAGFLTAIDLFQTSVVHAQGVISQHFLQQTATQEEVASAATTAKQHYRELLLARAAMRLSVSGDDADAAEDLTDDATEFLDKFLEYCADPRPHLGYNTPLFLRLERCEVKLREGVNDWTLRARQRLTEGEAARTLPS